MSSNYSKTKQGHLKKQWKVPIINHNSYLYPFLEIMEEDVLIGHKTMLLFFFIQRNCFHIFGHLPKYACIQTQSTLNIMEGKPPKVLFHLYEVLIRKTMHNIHKKLQHCLNSSNKTNTCCNIYKAEFYVICIFCSLF